MSRRSFSCACYKCGCAICNTNKSCHCAAAMCVYERNCFCVHDSRFHINGSVKSMISMDSCWLDISQWSTHACLLFGVLVVLVYTQAWHEGTGSGAHLTSNSTSSSNSWWIIVMCKSFPGAVWIKIVKCYVSTFFHSALLLHCSYDICLSTIRCFGGVGLYYSGMIRGHRVMELTWQVILRRRLTRGE